MKKLCNTIFGLVVLTGLMSTLLFNGETISAILAAVILTICFAVGFGCLSVIHYLDWRDNSHEVEM